LLNDYDYSLLHRVSFADFKLFSYLLLKLHNMIYFLTTAFVDVVSGTVSSEVASAGIG